MKSLCEQDIYERYLYYEKDTIKYLSNQVWTLKRYKRYFEYLKRFIIDDNKEYLMNYFNHNNIKSCALYGMNELGRFYVDFLCKHTNIEIKYIISNNEISYKGLKIIRENSNEFLVVDCVIIVDIFNLDVIRKKIVEINYSGYIIDSLY